MIGSNFLIHRDLVNGSKFRFMGRDSNLSIVTTENISSNSSREIVPIFIDSAALARSVSKYCMKEIPLIHTPLRFDAHQPLSILSPLFKTIHLFGHIQSIIFIVPKILEHDNETFSIN